MKKLIYNHLAVLILISGLLGGCQGTKFGDFIATVKSAASGTVSPEAIYIARNAFNVVEVSATNYLNLQRCPKQAPFCRDPEATKQLIPAIRSGRDARNAATVFLKEHPNELGPQGLYDALTISTDTIKGILARYNVGN